MHTLVVIIIALLVVIALFLGLLAFVLIQVYFVVQPIPSQFGKVSMIIEGVSFVRRRIHRYRQKRRNVPRH